jgi:hypothetical protein
VSRGVAHRILHVLALVDRGGKYLKSHPAAIHQLDGRQATIVGEEVPLADLRQPARQLLQVLLALLKLGEGELSGPRFLLNLGEESFAALGELVVLTVAVGLEAPDYYRVQLRRGSDSGRTSPLPPFLSTISSDCSKNRRLSGVCGRTQAPFSTPAAPAAGKRRHRATRELDGDAGSWATPSIMGAALLACGRVRKIDSSGLACLVVVSRPERAPGDREGRRCRPEQASDPQLLDATPVSV